MPLSLRSLAALLVLAVGGLVAACDPMPVAPGDAAADARLDPPPDGGYDGGHAAPPDAAPDASLHDAGLYEDICGPMPVGCAARLCVTSIHNPGWADCCGAAATGRRPAGDSVPRCR